MLTNNVDNIDIIVFLVVTFVAIWVITGIVRNIHVLERDLKKAKREIAENNTRITRNREEIIHLHRVTKRK